jgi:integrase
MSVRKRTWTTRGKLNKETGEREAGVQREAWIVDYTDQHGDRHIETFKLKKDAIAYQDKVRPAVRSGVHVAPGKSPTLKAAGGAWLESNEHALERATVDSYRQHLKYHLIPFIGALKLTDISTDVVLDLETRLRVEGRSKVMVRKVVMTLGSILGDAKLRKQVAHNAVSDLRAARRGKTWSLQREKQKLEIGKDIPLPSEITAILASAQGRWRPLLLTAAFTGLRGSELRGLRWGDVDLKANNLDVRQRADRYNVIGPPKTAMSRRTVPFGKVVANTLKEWKLECPPGELVFPTTTGKIQNHPNIIRDGLKPAQIRAGVTVPVIDEEGNPRLTKKGQPMVRAKYSGLHSLRHFYASLCINPRDLGGFAMQPKSVQERLGHSSITVTFDTYGHLFPRGDDSALLDAVEGELVAT